MRTLEPRKGFDISECDRCGAPCYVAITDAYPGKCADCKRGPTPREAYDALIDRIMEPLPPREALNMPGVDSWIDSGFLGVDRR